MLRELNPTLLLQNLYKAIKTQITVGKPKTYHLIVIYNNLQIAFANYSTN